MGTQTIEDLNAALEAFTLHSGQMGTQSGDNGLMRVLGFTLHSGQMGTDGVKLLIMTRFNLFR